MRRFAITALIPLTVPLAACGDDGPLTSLDDLGPFRDGWETVIEQPFTYLDDMDVPLITTVNIGGTGADGNFANRGDVIVTFDGSPGEIKVEMRKFAWTNGEDEANDSFEKLFAWAYTGNVAAPSAKDEADNCNADDGEWADACTILVYYEGQLEPQRFGADLKVTMPSDYRHTTNIVTEDNSFSEDYLNRGNVCVDGLNGRLDVKMEQGIAAVILDDAITPGPTCSAADIQACEEWADGAWGTDCPCQTFGTASVAAANSAANITFDAPAGLWAAIALDGTGDCAPMSVSWGEVDTSGTPWQANYPSDAATAGAGYTIRGEAGDCAPVRFTEDPDGFVGEGKADEQQSEDRGTVDVCSGCLRESDCDKLLPGT